VQKVDDRVPSFLFKSHAAIQMRNTLKYPFAPRTEKRTALPNELRFSLKDLISVLSPVIGGGYVPFVIQFARARQVCVSKVFTVLIVRL
jgi:hypothetical protein